MSSLSFPLCLNPLFTTKPLTSNTISPYTYNNSFQSLSKSYICFSISSSESSSFEREEARWLREEHRWLREEQRWIREESRWIHEREALLGEIETLRTKIEELENANDRNLNVGGVLQVLRNEASRIAERGSSAVPLEIESLEREDEVKAEAEVEVKEVIRVFEKEKVREDEVKAEVAEVVEVKEVIRVFEKEKVREDEVKKKRITLRKGSEGDDVRIMQEALLKLGFYCGEEDEEYSMFSSGTERAIKTWQASLQIPEDGIMTPELLGKLYGEQKNDVSGLTEKADLKRTDVATMQKASNGAAATHTTEVPEIQKRDAKEKGVAESKVPHSRVFLLGENRWEDSSRLIGRNKPEGGSINTETTRCISCRGEGRLLCSECDGTGEPNIEEQFMEWVDEGAKCPYCNGLGFEICDVCNGKVTS